MLPRDILRISRDLTPKSCSILLKALGWGYQLLGLNRGCTTRSLCQHHCGGGNLGTLEKPGKKQEWSREEGVHCTEQGKPLGESLGSKEKLFGIYFRITSLPARHGAAVPVGAKVDFRRVFAFKAESPLLITPHWNGKATESQEPGLCFGLTCRCDLVFP